MADPEEPEPEHVAMADPEEPLQDAPQPGDPSDAQPSETAPSASPIPIPPGGGEGAVGRPGGGIEGEGILNFEAMEHEIAPYLMEIRRRVEARWRNAMSLRYQGTQPTRAVIECVIQPDGSLAYARVLDAGNTLNFAPISRQAIEEAAPFPPFPFEPPPVYSNPNITIRWTFNYLRR